jgi:hypothetical protein
VHIGWYTIVILAIFIVFLVVIGMIPTWAGEWTYGPRYVLFILPCCRCRSSRFVDELVIDRVNNLARAAVGAVAVVCWRTPLYSRSR